MSQSWLYRVLCVILIQVVVADIYMHSPRGSNNRNCLNEANRENRRNGNRLFDSQNNAKGGYSCPRSFPFPCYRYPDGSAEQDACNAQNTVDPSKEMVDANGDLVNPEATKNPRMYYYTNSILGIEWTNQHGGGTNDKVISDVIIQMSCEGGNMMTDDCGDEDPTTFCGPRDGTPVNNNDNNNVNDEATGTIPENVESQDDGRYGRHETYRYYKACRNRERNKGLYIGDEDVNGNSARFTRQNPNGNRYGLECPEEAAYWPYWHPTPWIDLAVFTSDMERCNSAIAQSQNTVAKYQCVCNGDGCPTGEGQLPNNELSCTAFKQNNPEVDINWTAALSWSELLGSKAPECIEAPFSRDNHLGNVAGDGYVYGYNLTIPDYLAGKNSCVLRLRYNISNSDHSYVSVFGTSEHNTPEDETIIDGFVFDRDNSPKRVYESCNLGNDRFGHLGLAVNSNQYGRVFQDRSYTFSIKKAPEQGCEKIYNLGVRGKRGNIVQAYPAVEYDFTPNRLTVSESDCLHIQWTGSDYNPNRNPNDAEGGPATVDNRDQSRADRSNLVPMSSASDNRPCCDSSCQGWDMLALSETQWKRFMYLDQPTQTSASQDGTSGCATPSELFAVYDVTNAAERRRMEYNSTNCAKLSGAVIPYFDGGLVSAGKPGTYKYLSTRNNNFSNRGQKGSLTVLPTGLGTMEIVAIALGSVAFAALAGFAGVVAFRRRQVRRNMATGVGASKPPEKVKDAKPQAAPATGSSSTEVEKKTYFAAYDYAAREAGELSLKRGDIVTVISKDASGWWEGRLANGSRGVFPGTYVALHNPVSNA